MDDRPESKKTKLEITLVSMFQKKFKSMEITPALPNAIQERDRDEDEDEDRDRDGDEDRDGDGDRESSSSQNSQPIGMESGDSNADKIPLAENDQLVQRDQRFPLAENDQLVKRDHIVKTEYDACLTMCLQGLKFLLRQGIACCGQEDIWEWDSNNEGNFLELFKFLADLNEDFQKAHSENALEYYQITTLEVQKNLITACAKSTIKLIVQDLGDDYFGIIVDGTHDKYHEYHLSLYLHYVDKIGMVIERFLGVVLVDNFTAASCKAAIDSLLKEHSLNPCKIRGQSYNRTNSLTCVMNSDIDDLKTLIMKESQSAYHFHCYSHHIHLALVNAAVRSADCIAVFMRLADLMSLIRVACKQQEMLQETQAQKVLKALGSCELENRLDVIQEYGLQRPYESWEYDPYKTLLHVVTMFTTIMEVLDLIAEISKAEYQVKAEKLLYSFLSFEFVLVAHLMMAVLGYTDVLNRVLQGRDQGIANIISLVSVVKKRFQTMRSDNEWEKLLKEVSSFCVRNDIEVPDMNADYNPVWKSKRFVKSSTNLEYFQGEIYFGVIDQVIQELDSLFDETSMELLSCMACLNPADCFSSFDKQKLIKFAKFYPNEFSDVDLVELEFQLDVFITDMRNDNRFRNLKGIGELSVKLVETNKHELFSGVYLLVKLMLIFPVATPSIERAISGMHHVKFKLLNSVGNHQLYDSLTNYVEQGVFSEVLDDDIISCFKNIKVSQESQEE